MSGNLFSILDLIEENYKISGETSTISSARACFNEKMMIDNDNSVNRDKLESIIYLHELGDPLNKDVLDYIEAKIVKFITIDPYEIANCFEKYTIIETIVCNNSGGLSSDLMMILANMLNLKRDINEREDFLENINVVENRLGKYVPDILKNILDISELYEKKNCSKVSENTHMMKKLHSTIIKKNASHENYKMPNVEIGNYFDSFQDNIITKIALLAFFAYIIGKIISTFNVQYKVNPST